MPDCVLFGGYFYIHNKAHGVIQYKLSIANNTIAYQSPGTTMAFQ